MRRIRGSIWWVALIALWACRAPEGDLPEPYRGLAVPPEVAAPAADAVERGRRAYLAYCALCHGVEADGRGVRQHLSSPPRDLTQRVWCRSVTPRRLYFIVREGVAGTSMPSWKALPEAEIWDIVAYLSSLCEL